MHSKLTSWRQRVHWRSSQSRRQRVLATPLTPPALSERRCFTHYSASPDSRKAELSSTFSCKGMEAFNRVPVESDSISSLPPNSLSLSRIPAIPTPTSDPLLFILASRSDEIPLP